MGMNFGGHFNNFGVEVLNHSNYKTWRSCMESYLVREDLWEVVGGDDVNPSENVNNWKKWWIAIANVESIMKKSIYHGLFEHIIGCSDLNN